MLLQQGLCKAASHATHCQEQHEHVDQAAAPACPASCSTSMSNKNLKHDQNVEPEQAAARACQAGSSTGISSKQQHQHVEQAAARLHGCVEQAAA